MTNKQIAAAFNLLAKLMELHSENPFKIRSYQNISGLINKLGTPLDKMDIDEINSLKGVGSAISDKIQQLLKTGKMTTLERYKEKTPMGIQEMVLIKGLGPKKIKTVWDALAVESAVELLYACRENRLVELKGFGAKTQKEIEKKLEYFLQNKSKFLYAHIEEDVDFLLKSFRSLYPEYRFEPTGAYRRADPILESIEFICDTGSIEAERIGSIDQLTITRKDNTSLIAVYQDQIPVIIHLSTKATFGSQWIFTTGPQAFVTHMDPVIGKFSNECDYFQQLDLPFAPPEVREYIGSRPLPHDLISEKDIKGVIHAHTQYSDGINTVAEMAEFAKRAGYKYLGITDHSKIAVYANGVSEERLLQQWSEIDALNENASTFTILKGIECDILSNGDLDYSEDIWSQFDFIIASIHTNLRMDEEKATSRLIKAIENPYTNILGHPTGRLLLGRDGYPVRMSKIIDACAANQVAIELNASPYRLDLDYSLIPYAMEKGVMISINPDAHVEHRIDDIRYGVLMARKGWLTRPACLNTKSVQEFLNFCKK